MILSLTLLAAGLALLIVSGDLLVRGAVQAAENLGISPLVIGLTVVSAGTSLPELLISVQAALTGAPGIAIGNVVGSNIANVLLVIGVPAMMVPIRPLGQGLRRNVTAMIAATLVFMMFMSNGLLGRFEGLLLFACIIAYVYWQFWMARRASRSGQAAAPHHHDTKRVAAYLIGGLIGLPIAAKLTVNGGIGVAEAFNVPDTIIGLTVIAVGTSLPELATTVMAACRRSTAIALGNVVGSNIFNILGIMGLTALITPVAVDPHIIAMDMWVMLGAAIVVAILAFGRLTAGKWAGAAMLAAYAIYIVALI
ncbi:MAG: calcium/sodium antiporter [Rhizobiaceae bacterium]|nr:calcium/sodium antiporter [Rhizobiaceae bacterium]